MGKAVIYLRAGTLDQTTANQEHELRDTAARMGWKIVSVYNDHRISGVTGRRTRASQFDFLYRDAAKREFDIIMAWSVDHLGSSLNHRVGFLSKVYALKIDLIFA